MTDRRTFVALAGVLLVSPLAAEAQQTGKVPRIGYLGHNSAESNQPLHAAFREGLRERGWVDGQNIVIEARFADGNLSERRCKSWKTANALGVTISQSLLRTDEVIQ